MRNRTHGHLDEWAALVGEELPETIDDRAGGPGTAPESTDSPR